MLTETLKWLETDALAASSYLNGQPQALEVAATYLDLVASLYNERKDLAGVILMARSGMQFCLDRAVAAATARPDEARELLGSAKALAYNLASSAWPGWDEAGIDIGTSDLRIGLDAARTNLRLARELARGDLPLARAHWMLGAHQLASAAYQTAMASFDRASLHATAADELAEALLAEGFRHLAAAADPTRPHPHTDLAALDEVTGGCESSKTDPSSRSSWSQREACSFRADSRSGLDPGIRSAALRRRSAPRSMMDYGFHRQAATAGSWPRGNRRVPADSTPGVSPQAGLTRAESAV